MIKTTILISATIFGAVAASAQVPSIDIDADPATAEQVLLPLPKADTVIAQFSYLELRHGTDGFDVSVTGKTAVFLDVEFPGNLHIRIGF